MHTCRFCPIFQVPKEGNISRCIFLLAVKQDKRRERRSHAWGIKEGVFKKGSFVETTKKGVNSVVFVGFFFYQAIRLLMPLSADRQPETFAFRLKTLDYTLRFPFLKLSLSSLLSSYVKNKNLKEFYYIYALVDVNGLLKGWL